MAVIPVSPQTDITALIASDEVSEGDVLLLENGVYNQIVIVTKNFLRILAGGDGVVFDGGNILLNAFILEEVAGVEINGMKITNYQNNGIHIDGGLGHRIINNEIDNVTGRGIFAGSSTANLIWKNTVRRAFDGILLRFGSTNNRVVENLVQFCRDDGIESWLNEDENNVFAGNKASGNTRFGMEIFGVNNLVVDNIVESNGRIGLYVAGSDVSVIGNKIKNNNNSGILFDSSSFNTFVGDNEVHANAVFGMDRYSNQGSIQCNAITFNQSIGIRLNIDAGANLIYNNTLICNPPVNILDTSEDNPFTVPDNIILNNIDQPCAAS
ncbi:MAG: hypothetical protein GX044_01980 [Firmicutes bacterium]|nr:hypothetical protein [Bacillota bacterium]